MSREEDIYAAAAERPPQARHDFLERACASDEALRRRVEALLLADGEADDFFREPALPRPAPPAEEKPGDRIGRYKLLQKIGEGGCGVVYMAEQEEPVRRRVALKVIKLGMDTKAVIARFEAERQALALMDHPNIARVLDAGATDAGRPFFVMELVGGIPITRYCDEQNLSTTDRLRLFIQVCQAIQHAHHKGIIHRDIKPSNILVGEHDDVAAPKVIDFGIAKATQGRLTDHTLFTAFEQFIGTPAYMSPEQTQIGGLDVDTRSDIYSLGVLLYELLAGRPPFDPKTLAQSGIDEMRRVIREVEPPRPSTRLTTLDAVDRNTIARARGTAPMQLSTLLRGDLDWIVMKALEKNRARRYETASGLAHDIQRHLAHEPVVARPPSAGYRMQKFVRRHRVAFVTSGGIAAATALTVAVSIAVTARGRRLQEELRAAALRAQANESSLRREATAQRERAAKQQWARETALPEINRLISKDDFTAAFLLARAAEELIPLDPALTHLWPQISASLTIETNPPGADIHVKPYRKPAADWEYLGKSPLKNIRVARDFQRLRITKDGCAPLERAEGPAFGGRLLLGRLRYFLTPTDSTPLGMVQVQGGQTASLLTRLPAVQLSDFWIDRFEVTNREFKEFVDRGGYSTETFWKYPFVRGDKTLSWAEAMALFRDSTGRTGPSTWKNGTCDESEADWPVMGVSWFEAAAYAEFRGKRLPSIYHWRYASSTYQAQVMVPLSNFSRQAPSPVGRHQGVSGFGLHDMAGNAREWCWNEANPGKRYILGGAWDEPEYMFTINNDAQAPFDRSPNNGFRCMKLAAPGTAVALDAPLPRVTRTFDHDVPVSDLEFQQFRNSFSYDKINLAPQVESIDDTDPRWRKEKVSFNAAYNNERMAAFIFLPRKISPPFQAVVYFPSAGATNAHSSETLSDSWLYARFVANGRALVYPIYKGHYERGPRPGGGKASHRDQLIELSKDLGRSIDYLETRKDIQSDKLAYAGYSAGANQGALLPAIETRFKAIVLVGGGFPDTGSKELPMADVTNFAPRITAPTLMLNGRYDFIRALETSQVPMFRAFGTPAEHKRHVVFESGHEVPMNQAEVEINTWLDRYLGPVR